MATLMDRLFEVSVEPDEYGDVRVTPPQLRVVLSRRWSFTLDVAADATNTLADRYYTKADDGLRQPWFGVVWCNPPFSDPGAWVAQAWAEWTAGRPDTVVMLLPANRTEQPWWQRHVESCRDRPGSPLSTEFLAGRLRFARPGGVAPTGVPPFGCVLLVWERRR